MPHLVVTRERFIQTVEEELQLVKLILQEDHRTDHVRKIDRAIALIAYMSSQLDGLGGSDV